MRARVQSQSQDDPGLKIEYETIVQRVREAKDSVLHAQEHRFIDPVETIQGTVSTATLGGVELEEYPGRVFRFSSIGTSMADYSGRPGRTQYLYPLRDGLRGPAPPAAPGRIPER